MAHIPSANKSGREWQSSRKDLQKRRGNAAEQHDFGA